MLAWCILCHSFGFCFLSNISNISYILLCTFLPHVGKCTNGSIVFFDIEQERRTCSATVYSAARITGVALNSSIYAMRLNCFLCVCTKLWMFGSNNSSDFDGVWFIWKSIFHVCSWLCLVKIGSNVSSDLLRHIFPSGRVKKLLFVLLRL